MSVSSLYLLKKHKQLIPLIVGVALFRRAAREMRVENSLHAEF